MDYEYRHTTLIGIQIGLGSFALSIIEWGLRRDVLENITLYYRTAVLQRIVWLLTDAGMSWSIPCLEHEQLGNYD